MMPWVCLFVAGALEVVWAVGLRYSEGLTRPWPALVTVVALAGSMALLAQATRALPLGTAYAVWVGIGACGTAAFGILALGESATPARLGFLALLLLSIAGLKLTA